MSTREPRVTSARTAGQLLRVSLAAGLLWAAAFCGQTMAQEPEAAAARPKPPSSLQPDRASYLKLADEVESVLRRDVLDAWFPRSIDEANGGFRSDFTREWKPARSGGKFSVFQGRMTWVAAQVVMRRPDLKDRFLPVVRHGLEFLDKVMWDKDYGGFFWQLDDDGAVTPSYGDAKQLYGMSFCLYGAAAAFQATRDPKALELAERAFRWIDRHAHDAVNGGYFEQLTREGRVIDAGSGAGRPSGVSYVGFKSMNTHIHLLESFAQLYEVWKDELLRKRLEELLVICRDRICVEPGVMNLFFTPDWRAIPDHDSYGHDIETAYLMLEAEDVLGRGHDPKTERMAKMLVDHGYAYGWDRTTGGFCRHGTTFGQPEDRRKEWWMQFEGLNALLLMHEKYGRDTSTYFEAFQRQWQFIKDYQIDAEFHGVYEMIGPEGAPTVSGKGRIWKAAYHDGRALLNVSERLRRLAKTAAR
jgi:mannobiose 2-epimerase